MSNRGSFWVASHENSLIVKVRGFATQNNSLLFKDFVEEMLKQGFTEFIIDLCECRGMDSTFLGVMAGITSYIQKTDRSADFPITLVNTTAYHQKIIDSLGLSCILAVKAGITNLPDVTMQELENQGCDYKTRIEMIREAHENLIQLNEHNKQQFQQFLDLLLQELHEQQKTSK